MLSEREIALNQRAFENAIAQQELEGLTVSQSVKDDLQRVVRGEMTTTQAIKNIYSQFPDVEIFQS